MDMELKRLEKILEKIPQIAKESYKYWVGQAGDYHRTYLLQWYRDSMELVTKIRKETEDVR